MVTGPSARALASVLATATGTATPTGGTVGVSSQWTFGTGLVWLVVVALALYVLYRRFGF